MPNNSIQTFFFSFANQFLVHCLLFFFFFRGFCSIKLIENNWSFSYTAVSIWIVKNQTHYAGCILRKHCSVILWSLFRGLCEVCLAAFTPRPMETNTDRGNSLCILAATGIAIIKFQWGRKNKKTELSFLFRLREVPAAEIWEHRQCRCCRCHVCI